MICMVVNRKKLIEVALPLEAINVASAREKSIRHGHPSTLHLWWARRPLAAARAVIFSQMVDDPSGYVDTLLGEPTTRRAAERELKKKLALWEKLTADFAAATGKETVTVPEPGPKPTLEDVAADIERERLFDIIRELVTWENTTNEVVLDRARAEIWQSWRRTCVDNVDHPRAKELFDRHKLPAFHDPFAGGGALPLEAQRLGLEAYATDLNPVAVLINKAMIEIPPKFAGLPPINPDARAKKDLIDRQWKGAQGLAEDVRYYGQWMRDEAEKRIGHLYPKIEITEDMAKERSDLKPLVGRKLTIIAWLWARTVKSPNPAFTNIDVPLASTFMLCTKPGKESYVEPIIEAGSYRFEVRVGTPENAVLTKLGTAMGKRAAFRCLMSDVPVSYDYIRSQGKAGQMGARLMATVVEGDRGRVYLPPTESMEKLARSAKPDWRPDIALPINPRDFKTPNYGLDTFGDLFTQRQLVALTTFSGLVEEARTRVAADARAANFPADPKSLAKGGAGAQAFADAVAIYLGLAIGRQANRTATLNFWDQKGENVQQVFARQALPMTWDFVEGNPLSTSTGNFIGQLDYLTGVLDTALSAKTLGNVFQKDAQTQEVSIDKVISTDPPYYDNRGYAELSDFFYVWLRRALRQVLPELFTTLAVPKAEELVATPYRHGGKDKAEAFFLTGMTEAMSRLAGQTHIAFPVTIYYAFKQSEDDAVDGTASTGWETFIDAVIRAGFAISGTWPMRTEYTGNLKKNMSALASSIILVCRPRLASAATATRREFLTVLKAELPAALAHLQRGNIAPVDLAQASIGPGMAVYTRYAKVVDAEGKTLTVREALALINQTLDEVLSEQEGDFDSDSRWAVAWFDQIGFAEGEFGTADTLARAKVTSVAGLVEAGILVSKAGKVHLLKPIELPEDWDPLTDKRLTVWEMVHHLIRVLEAHGENAAALLVAKLGVKAEVARELAYRLYNVCERKKRATEALSYNALVQSWPEISRLSRASLEAVIPPAAEPDLFEGN
jgi:putative DNA methylase